MTRRVVVTGIGAVTPLGHSAEETWASALQGKSGVGRITHFELGECPVTIAAEVRNYDISPFLNAKEARKMARFCHLAIGAGMEAYRDSGLGEYRTQIPAERFGTNVGVGMGGLPELEEIHKDLLNKGYKRVTPFLVPIIIPNMASGHLSILLDLKGPNLCNLTACASSAHAIGESYRIIQRGDADLMLTGGAEAVISPMGIGGFAAMRALSSRNDAPEKASRPFDVERDGFVMGEGAAILILEEYEHAKKRRAKIYGEICGYGLTGDAYHMTTPSPGGEGGFRAMKLALEDSSLGPEQIGYVNAHGTSTPAGDAEEAGAIARLFPEGPRHLHVSSTKSMTGHMLGAAGAIEAMFSVLAIRDGKIPPTINLDQLDPACESTKLNFTPHRAVEKPVQAALTNSFGFGGTNASLIFKKV